MPPPPAQPLATRVFLGPALRTQPDRRLVKLVREGYETAFEEIVRRYRRPLDRFAAAIVGSRSEDVTQDAFSKALLALRGSETDIELRPWLYRIVRNTALNDLRDRGPVPEELAEALPGGLSAAEEAERREEMADLTERLRSLPEPQRAAIVMRELEGLSHKEIATALGVSGGAARQAIYRARAALREGAAVLVPLPLLKVLFDHGAEAAAGAGGLAAGAAGASAAGGGGAALGGLGAGGALKVGAATLLVAGTVGAGVAIQHERGGKGPEPAEASSGITAGASSDSVNSGPGSSGSGGDDRGSDNSGPGGGEGGDDNGGHGREPGDDHGGGPGPSDDSGPSQSGGSGSSGSGDDDSGHHSSRRGSSGGGSGSGDDDSGHHGGGGIDDHSGSGHSGSGSSGGGSSGSGSGGHGSDDLSGAESNSGSGSSGSGSGGSGSGSSGSGSDNPVLTTPPPPVDDGGGSGDPGGSGSGESGGGSGSDDGI
ncbi:MAG TPA: RNA polymerase sigma factor [Solirubrobacterales bacterium]|nr:RNA polymerase sigma factor [Solirubrobacterales bacterium]